MITGGETRLPPPCPRADRSSSSGAPAAARRCCAACSTATSASRSPGRPVSCAPPAAQAFIPFWPYGERWHRRLGVEDAEFEARLGEFYGSLFRDHAEREGKARWGDATPWHVWHLDGARAPVPATRASSAWCAIPGGNVESAMARLGRTRRVATQRYARDNRELVRQAVGARRALRAAALRGSRARARAGPARAARLARRAVVGADARRRDRARMPERAAAWAGRSTAARARICATASAASRGCSATASATRTRARRSNAGAPERRLLDGTARGGARARAAGRAAAHARGAAGRAAVRPAHVWREPIRPTVVTLRDAPPAERPRRADGRRRRCGGAARRAPPRAGFAAPPARVSRPRARARPSEPPRAPSLEGGPQLEPPVPG